MMTRKDVFALAYTVSVLAACVRADEQSSVLGFGCSSPTTSIAVRDHYAAGAHPYDPNGSISQFPDGSGAQSLAPQSAKVWNHTIPRGVEARVTTETPIPSGDASGRQGFADAVVGVVADHETRRGLYAPLSARSTRLFTLFRWVIDRV
ncbi:MAG: hypothetical protein AAGJ94_04865 [Pseudomonadota bacterium]